jgi:hypothetical protein
MNIARVTNSSTNSHCSPEQQTEIVSRADIFSEGAHFTADSDKLAKLDELLKASFGSFDVLQTRKRAGSVEGRSELRIDSRKSGSFTIFD